MSFVGTAVIISKVKEKNHFIAFLIGGFWYFVGFFVPAYLYYCVMFEFSPLGLISYQIAHLLIYFAFMPIVVLFNKKFQSFTQKQDLQSLIVI